MITILDIRHGCPADAFYVGRPMPKYHNPKLDRDLLSAVHCGSVLRNQWRPGEDADPIGRYRRWLYQRLCQQQPLVQMELAKLVDAFLEGDLTLACWCAKAPRQPYRDPWNWADGCHADVIASCVVWLAKEAMLSSLKEYEAAR